uniref:KH RNA binding domain containing, signal transduction associated 2 n=1 Tax=Sphenodon punctatus TaxID=8508 RepID=A0A8D0L4Z4_SPHPU
HCALEIEKFQGSDGKKEDEEKKYLDVISNKNIKLSERVLIPVKQYPKFNFVGKLLGPRGNSLKRLQEETGAKMSILGKGSMRDKAKEEELRKSGEAKYAHLSDELHVLIEVFAPPGEAYSRMSHALEEIKKFLVPDYNDEIRQEQLRELSYLNGSEDSPRGRGIRGRGIRVPPAGLPRGRGGAIPPPPPGRGAQAPRGTPVTRGALPVPPVARGVPTPRARGAPAVPGYRPPPPPAHEAYEDYVSNICFEDRAKVVCQTSRVHAHAKQASPLLLGVGCYSMGVDEWGVSGDVCAAVCMPHPCTNAVTDPPPGGAL